MGRLQSVTCSRTTNATTKRAGLGGGPGCWSSRMQELIGRFSGAAAAGGAGSRRRPRPVCVLACHEWLRSASGRSGAAVMWSRHVRRPRRRPEHPLASATVGDARSLPHGAGSADVVLLMGPLYHLPARELRLAALREAYRVLKSGGILVAKAINRLASLLDGITRGFIDDPEVCGHHPPRPAGGTAPRRPRHHQVLHHRVLPPPGRAHRRDWRIRFPAATGSTRCRARLSSHRTSKRAWRTRPARPTAQPDPPRGAGGSAARRRLPHRLHRREASARHMSGGSTSVSIF